ncbi:MAG: carbohydrate kinase [Tannerellaceae bacterium]|nr:carbohydrate kinase [Tannerellaceae bacterium]
MRKVIGIGETILDIIFKGDQPYKAVPGGSVFNGLVSLGRTGIPVLFISELGNDKVGDIIRDFMKRNHISTDFVDCFPDGKSPVSMAFLDEQQNASYLFYKDYPNQRLEVTLPPIEEDDIFIFGSYYSLNPALRERMVEFIEYARERKAILYYDPNFRNAHAHEAMFLTPVILDNMEAADIVRGSDEDFCNIFKKTDMQEIYREHVEYYCPTLITTHGADGVNLFTSGGNHSHYNSLSVTPVSTIGAGDNFNAGILYGLLKYNIRKKDLPDLSHEMWEKVIRYGIEFSAEVCCSYDNYVSVKFAESYLLPKQS